MEAKIISQDTFLNYVQKSSVARDIGPLFLSRSNMVLNMNLGLRICIQKNFHVHPGERAGTSRGHHAKIVLESPEARLCRTMITRGGGEK